MERLRRALAEVEDLDRVATLLSWDQQTCMPAAGATSRGQQMGLLGRLAHERLVSPAMGRLLDELEASLTSLDAEDAALVRAARRSFELARRVPGGLVQEAAEATAEARRAWRVARSEANWDRFAPCLARNVDIHLRIAGAVGYERHPYDALLERRERMPSTDELRALFGEIERAVTPLLTAVGDAADDGALRGDFDEAKQLEVARWLLERIGFDFDRGRLDVAAHPFSASPGPDDVRVAVRVRRDSLATCLYATLHEGGHALYDQGVARSLDRTPLWPSGASAVHESQARLWENLVGRSRPFWDFLTPSLRVFGLEDVESLHRAANAVRPSYIRAEADEVTYNLHVLIRFEIENDLLEGRLAAADVPEAWNAALRRALGLDPPGVVEGPLQDIQWCGVTFGLFPVYTLGNLISAQLMARARADLGDLDAQLRSGEFEPLLSWLRARVHRHGRRLTLNELLLHVTGEPLSAGPWIEHVRRMCAEVHGAAA